MVRAQKIIYAKRFEGLPTLNDFVIETEELPELKDGDVLAEAVFLSVDPYMRAYMKRYPVGVTMIGAQVAKVIATKNPKFPLGSNVFGQFGWRTHTVFHPEDQLYAPILPYVLPAFGELSPSLSLGVLGLTGISALYGLLDVCQPKAGEIVVVTGAAGSVGSIAGQIAKSLGCIVVGLAGDDAKCEWLRTIGFDHAINYKTANVAEALQTAAPDGFDCYFDNVGGELSSIIIAQMRLNGRISVCGSISTYNATPENEPKCSPVQVAFIGKQLSMKGFHAHQFAGKWMEGVQQLVELVLTKKIVYHETVTQGFEQMPSAFIDMLSGGNTGKAIVHV